MAHVLVVDDDEITRTLVGRTLQDAGHEVMYAVDGSAALARIERQDFDVVITALAMPEMNGLRLIRHLSEASNRIPVIAISGQNAEQLLLAADHGVSATLFKPVNPAPLLAAVEGACESTNVWADVWY